jgi:hypothetical protein
MSIKSRDWNEIAESYRRLVKHGWDIQPLLRLVEEIIASGYVHGIYATTSMATLCIAQTPEFEMNQNMLRVDFERGRFFFSYHESLRINKAWKKECGRDEGFSTFEHVMNRLKWFLD